MAIIGQLHIQLGGQIVKTVEVTGPTLTLGRLPENDLMLEGIKVSRRHAELRVEQGTLVLTDMGSTAGTIVNGTPLLPHQPQALVDGAVIEIGLYTIIYQSGEGPPLSLQSVVSDATPVLPMAGSVHVGSAADTTSAGRRSPSTTMARSKYPVMEYARDAASVCLPHLPIIFQDNDFLRRYLLIVETLWEPLEQRQDQIAMYFDPLTCPATFLPWLASWFGFPVNKHWPETLTRSLLREIVELYRWRGTSYGMTRLLEVYTGITPQITAAAAEPFLFRIKVKLPADRHVSREEITNLINLHKPAHIGYVLEAET